MDKSGMSEALVSVFSFIVIIMLMIVFWYTFAYIPNNKISYSITSEDFEMNEIMSLNYLRTPNELNDIKYGSTFGDLIVYSVNNNDFKILEEQTTKLFKDSSYYWYLTLKKDNNVIASLKRKDLPKYTSITPGKQSPEKVKDIFLPDNNGGNITVSFSLTQGNIEYIGGGI